MKGGSVKGLAVVCGVGLAILWLVGLGDPVAPGWFTWLDGVAAVWSFVLAGSLKSTVPRSSDVGNASLLSLGLFALWIVGLSTQAMPWQNWWTFSFACGIGIVAISSAVQRNRGSAAASEDQDRNRFRKAG